MAVTLSITVSDALATRIITAIREELTVDGVVPPATRATVEHWLKLHLEEAVMRRDRLRAESAISPIDRVFPGE